MKNFLTIGSVLLLFTSCGCETKTDPQNYITYQNIVILSDMSSRIDNKESKDLEEINKLVLHFKNDCVKPGEKIGDRSSIYFSTFPKKIVASIDLDDIKNTAEKQRFVNSTEEYKNNGLVQKIEDFKREIISTYSTTRNEGLDLISILCDKIDNDPVIKKDTYLSDGIDTTFIKYDNHIYIFTDGYLEYKGKNKEFYFGNEEIKKVRKFCNDRKIDIAKALETNSSLCLPAIKSNKNKHITLHVVETHERDKNDNFQTYKYAKGLRDNEILEAVWRKWAKESGFKDLEWRKY
jgi:hypothetical protein